MNWLTIGGMIARHALSIGGGIAVGKGYIDASTAEQIIGGVMSLAGLIWSAVQKNNSGALAKN
jgi:hypothetical protein